eukprot:3250666-Rhodomonas_salina.5
MGKRLATSGPGGRGALISIQEQQGMDGDRSSSCDLPSWLLAAPADVVSPLEGQTVAGSLAWSLALPVSPRPCILGLTCEP